MNKIFLFCSTGISASLVASKMKVVAEKHNLPIEIKAFTDCKIDMIYDQYHPDVLLLGPQINFKFSVIYAKYNPIGIPVEVINLEDYQKVDAERILKRAIQLLKSKNIQNHTTKRHG